MPCNVFRWRNVLIAHITASVFINDDERGLHADYDDWLEKLVPHKPISRYRHNRTGEACPEAPPGRVEGWSRRDNGAPT